MIRSFLLASVALLATTSACGPVNRSVNTVKTPTIQSTQLAHDVRFDGYDSLPTAQARGLEEWLGSIGIGYGDRISVDDPVVAGAASRRAAIAGVVAKFGLMVDEAAPITAALPAGAARVVVTRSKVIAPDCPDWRRDSNPEIDASSMSNFGCATVSNIAAMVADPNDLVEGQTYTGADGQTTSKAITVFRERKPTGVGPLRVEDVTTTNK